MASLSRMTSTALPVARLSSPAEIAALIPLLVGFVPSESVVVVSLRPPRKRVGLTMRVDLPAVEHEPLLAEQLAQRLEQDGAMAALVVVYTSVPDIDERAGLRLVDAIGEAAFVPVTDALLIRHGRWWSYFCDRARCCPADGTPVEAADTPALRLASAESVLSGRSVLPSRTALVQSVAPPRLLAEVAARQRLDAATDALLEHDVAARGDAVLDVGRVLLAACAEGHALDPRAVASFAAGLRDVAVRDDVATWALDRPDDLLGLLQQVARAVVPPYDAPVCTLLAWVAYAGGDGGLANVALDRALASEPDYSMAQLLRTALDGQVPPATVREILRRTRGGGFDPG